MHKRGNTIGRDIRHIRLLRKCIIVYTSMVNVLFSITEGKNTKNITFLYLYIYRKGIIFKHTRNSQYVFTMCIKIFFMHVQNGIFFRQLQLTIQITPNARWWHYVWITFNLEYILINWKSCGHLSWKNSKFTYCIYTLYSVSLWLKRWFWKG